MNQLTTLSAPPMPLGGAYQRREAPAQDTRDLIDILIRRKSWIVITTMVALALAAFFILQRDREWMAHARILVDPRGLQIIDKDATRRAETSDGNIAHVESQLRVLTSDSILRKVIDKEHLLDDPEFLEPSPGPLGMVRGFISGLFKGSSEPRDPETEVLRNLSEAVSASRPERSYVIDLWVKTKDPDKSARLANAIAETYLNSEVKERAALLRRASDALGSRLADLRAQLNEAEDKVERYKVAHNILGTGDVPGTRGQLVNEKQLDELNSLLVAASGRVAAARAKLDQIRAYQQSGDFARAIPETVTSNTIGQLTVQYSLARQREQALAARLLPGHPELKEARARTQSIRAVIVNELRRFAAAAKAEYDRETANLKTLQRRLAELKRTAYSTNDARVKLRELRRDAEAKRGVYEAFLVRSRELREQEQVDPTIARVISTAIKPDKPQGPGTPLILVIALCGGLGLGGVLAVARDSVDRSVRTPRQLEMATGLPVLGAVPVRVNPARDHGLPEFVIDRPTEPESIAMRALLSRLPAPSGAGPRVVMLTSPGDNHGKTTIATNLALLAARKGERVLLIDGDSTRRSLSRIRYQDPDFGLADVVAGYIPLKKAVVHDRSGLVETLPMGRDVDPRSFAGLDATDFRERLYDAVADYDLLIVDADTSLRDVCSAAFAQRADAIVLVIRQGEADARTLTAASEALASYWSKVAGIAFVTDAPRRA